MKISSPQEELLLKIIGQMSKSALEPKFIMSIAKLARQNEDVFRLMKQWLHEKNREVALAIIDDLHDCLDHDEMDREEYL